MVIVIKLAGDLSHQQAKQSTTSFPTEISSIPLSSAYFSP